MLGTRQLKAPRRCQSGRRCYYAFGKAPDDAVYIPWLTRDEVVLWYLLVCIPCWRRMPDPLKRRAINPPPSRLSVEGEPALPVQPVPSDVPVDSPSAAELLPPYDNVAAPRHRRWGSGGPRRWHKASA